MKSIVLATALSLCAAPLWAQDQITPLLDWVVNPDRGPVTIGREKGRFEDRGPAVEVIAPADPSERPDLIAAAQAGLAISCQPQLNLQIHEGLPVRRIGTLGTTPVIFLLVMVDGPVKTPTDPNEGGVGVERLPRHDELICVANMGTMSVDMIRRFLAETGKASRYIIDHIVEGRAIFAATASELGADLDRRV